MGRLVARLWEEQEGQDLVEYALLLTLISLALVTAINGLATAISNTFTNASGQLT